MLLFVVVYSLSCVWFFATPWTVANQALPSMGFPRQEYWSELLFPSPEDLPNTDGTNVSCMDRQILYRWATRKDWYNIYDTILSIGSLKGHWIKARRSPMHLFFFYTKWSFCDLGQTEGILLLTDPYFYGIN